MATPAAGYHGGGALVRDRVANIALAIHIYHGAWSMFQSLGINNPKWNDARRKFAIGFALLIGVANVSFPLLVVTGVVS